MRGIPLFILVFSILWSPGKGDDVGLPDKSLTGRITDKNSGEAIPGVYIYIPDLKTGSVTDLNGKYEIHNLPAVKVLVQASYVGYRTALATIDLSKTSVHDFVMDPSAIEMNEVVISGISKAGEIRRNPAPITVIKSRDLQQSASTNIIDAIAREPGISQITTGPGISKPVIRGLGYNRVVVVNDGIRQEGQQWGDEHGIEIDESSVNKVQIIKGPASLAYGSDAMAGVIEMISAPSVGEGTIEGNISANGQSNNGLLGYSADLAGNLHGFIWDARYGHKLAHAYRNHYDGYVFNSGFRENAANGMIGLNKSWGYAHLIASAYDFMPGIIEGDRDSVSGKFIKPVMVNSQEATRIADHADFISYKPDIPFQKIHHYKAVLDNNFIMGNSNLKTTLGFQQNQRQEYADILTPDTYNLYFLLNTYTYNIQYNFPEFNPVDISVGTGGMQQYSLNKGREFLIPAYHLFESGYYATLKKSFSNIEINGGIRYDFRHENVEGLYLSPEGLKTDPMTPGALEKFKGFKTGFSGISGSLGLSYNLSETVVTKFNISRGFRAPNIAELGANGVHEGTLRYEMGNPDLKAEGSWQFDYGIGLNSHHVSAELDLFDNEINHFIFLRKLETRLGADSVREGFDVFKYFSGNARLYGGEVRIDIHPHPWDWLHIENSFSYVNSIQRDQLDSTRYLPFTPAPRYQGSLKIDIKKIGKILSNGYIRLEIENYFLQNRVFSAYRTETPTPGYALLNLGLGGDIISNGNPLFSLYFSIENLTDKAYQNHLSRLKYADVNYVTGRAGVFNMGRNFSLKVIVPVQLMERHPRSLD